MTAQKKSILYTISEHLPEQHVGHECEQQNFVEFVYHMLLGHAEAPNHLKENESRYEHKIKKNFRTDANSIKIIIPTNVVVDVFTVS